MRNVIIRKRPLWWVTRELVAITVKFMSFHVVASELSWGMDQYLDIVAMVVVNHNYIASFASMELPPEDSGQGLLPSSPRDKSIRFLKTRIDFEKTYCTDRFCKGVPSEAVEIDPTAKIREKRRFREISPFFAPITFFGFS